MALGWRGSGAADADSVPTVVGLTRDDLDVTDPHEVLRRIEEEAPDRVIHCAAYTGVDRAESRPDVAMAVNRGGTEHVAAAASRVGALLVYISTDYVFDGEGRRPYRPDDPVGPRSVYGRSKLAGEQAALGAGGVVVRTGWLYGAGGRNFVDAILERAQGGEALQVVDDQHGRPTWARNVARTTMELVDAGVESGIWHVADAGEATWLELAREALERTDLSTDVEGVSTEFWGAPAPRPRYSVLDLSATEARIGRPMMDWREALGRYLEDDERRRRAPTKEHT